MKTLLIQPYTATDHTAGNFKKFLAAMPPISLAYVAAAMEQAGLEVCAYDDFLFFGDDNLLINTINREKPDLIGLSCVTPNYPGVERITNLVRRLYPHIKIVLGNIHADIFPAYFLNNGMADYIVHGEGEITVVKLINALIKDIDLADVKGISFKRDNKIIFTGHRAFIEDLDSIPFPAWHLFPYEKYKIFGFARILEPATLVLGSRGCTYKCNYCSLKVMGTARRKRSVKNIADEFEFMHEKYGFKQMSFVDPIFPVNEKEAISFRNELISRNLHKKMIWITETRVDLMKKNTAEAMAESGCKRVMFGFETGSNDTLASIKKRTNLNRAKQAVTFTKNAGMEIIGFFMIGVPGDTHKSINETISFSRSLNIDFAKYTVFVPYPGTDIYNDFVKEKLIEPESDWYRYTSYPTKKIHTIYTAPGLTNDDLIYYQKKAFRAFYLRPLTILKHLFVIRTFKIKEMIAGFFLVANIKNLFSKRAIAKPIAQ